MESVATAFTSRFFSSVVREVSSHCFEGTLPQHYTSAYEALRGSEADRKPNNLFAPADAIVEDGEQD